MDDVKKDEDQKAPVATQVPDPISGGPNKEIITQTETPHEFSPEAAAALEQEGVKITPSEYKPDIISSTIPEIKTDSSLPNQSSVTAPTAGVITDEMLKVETKSPYTPQEAALIEKKGGDASWLATNARIAMAKLKQLFFKKPLAQQPTTS